LTGLRVTRPPYAKLTQLDEGTATHGLVQAADTGLLEARGERRGRRYVAGVPLRQILADLNGAETSRRPVPDPPPRDQASSAVTSPSNRHGA
jgi:hypothetical protein